ncbi:MAG: aspartate kinase [Deltaproteobacteria bacterium]
MMLVVQKYGGSSLATPKHIQNAAQRISALKKSGSDVVVVASAMGHTTDHLLKLARKTVKVPPSREVDMLLTAGERISMSLLSMALQDLGIPAISFTGSQSGIITTNDHTEAKIIDIRPHRILEELGQGKVVIIAGFQGVSEKKEITTLGRGGSDTTAVALAAVLKADRCEILTDVDGLFSADPRVVPAAKILTQVDYDQALEMASLGAKMQARSIELAKKFQVNVQISSSRTESSSGTLVQSQKVDPKTYIEQIKVSAVATKDGFHLFHSKTSLPAILEILVNANLPLRFLSFDGEKVTFLTEKEKVPLTRSFFEKQNLTYEEIENVSTVSVIGDGLIHSNRLSQRVIEFLKQENLECLLISSHSASLSFVVRSAGKTILANFIHQHFLN